MRHCGVSNCIHGVKEGYMEYSFILLAGGNGSRTGKAIPKQFLNIAGKSMIVHTLERVEKINAVKEVIVVCLEGYEEKIELYRKVYNLQKTIKIVKNGMTRQESVYNALREAKYPSIILHEAARPFVKVEEFMKLIENENENVTYGYDIPFTVLQGHDEVTAIIDRNSIFNVQLPQKFDTKMLRNAYEIAIKNKKNYTEDASLMFDCINEKVHVIKGSKYNVKITEDIDLLLAELIYNEYVLGGKYNE